MTISTIVCQNIKCGSISSCGICQGMYFVKKFSLFHITQYSIVFGQNIVHISVLFAGGNGFINAIIFVNLLKVVCVVQLAKLPQESKFPENQNVGINEMKKSEIDCLIHSYDHFT